MGSTARSLRIFRNRIDSEHGDISTAKHVLFVGDSFVTRLPIVASIVTQFISRLWEKGAVEFRLLDMGLTRSQLSMPSRSFSK